MILLIATCLFAINPNECDRSMQLLSSWPFGPAVKAVAMDTAGRRAYFSSAAGIYALDISTPSAPIKITDAVHASVSINDLYYDDGYLYIALIGGGIEIWDVASLDSARFVSYIDTPGDASQVRESDHYLYVADGNPGLRIIDIADPYNPQEVGSYASGTYIGNVYVAGQYAFISDFSAGVRIVDISNPSNPVFVSMVAGLHYRGLNLKGNYLFAAIRIYGKGLDIIDITDINNPQIISSVDSMASFDIVVKDTIAYALGQWDLFTINIADIYHPFKMGHYPTQDVCYMEDLGYCNGYLYVPEQDMAPGIGGYLEVYTVANPYSPHPCGFYPSAGYAPDFYIAWNWRYDLMPQEILGLKIISIADILHPTEISEYHPSGWGFCYDIRPYIEVASYKRIIMATGTGIEIADISNVMNPTYVSSLSLTDYPEIIEIESGSDPHYAWTLSDMYLSFISISSTPSLIRRVYIYQASDLYYANNYVYVAAGSAGLRIFSKDLTTEYGCYNTPGSAQSVNLVNRLAYVADGSGGLRIVNVADPLNPVETGACPDVIGACKVTVKNYRAYVAAYDSGLYVVDVRDSTNPSVSDRQLIPGKSVSVSARGDTVCVLTFYSGCYFYTMSPIGVEQIKTKPTATAFWAPTVIRSGSLPVFCRLSEPLRIEFDLYNSLGQKIQSLADIHMNSGPHQLDFQLNNPSSGVYFIVMQSKEIFKSRKIVIIN